MPLFQHAAVHTTGGVAFSNDPDGAQPHQEEQQSTGAHCRQQRKESIDGKLASPMLQKLVGQ